MTGVRLSGSSGTADVDEGLLMMHASCVAFNGQAVLVLGASGAGKSSLALQLMAFGGVLVSDDRTCLQTGNGGIMASAPAAIKGLIEARGVGILAAQKCALAEVKLIVDLDNLEQDRLPKKRAYILLGQPIPMLHKVDAPHFPAAIIQYIKGGRSA